MTSHLQLEALLQHAAIAPLTSLGWLRFTGDDRVRWLNGMVTNSIQELAAGHGNYNFLLNAQGRIQGDGYVFAEPEALLLQSATAQLPQLTALLDRFIIMDDVELTQVTDVAGLLVAGPAAAALLQTIGIDTASLAPIQRRSVSWNSGIPNAAPLHLIAAYSPLVPRFELWADPATIAVLTSALLQAGAVSAEPDALEALRLLEGTPRYGTDIRDKELPQETAPNGVQSRSLHFAKGCYLGQEIVERIRSRGQVHRTFTAFRLHGTLPPAGTPLEADGKVVGELTSTAVLPSSAEPVPADINPAEPTLLALGYIRREALERNLTLTYAGGTATATRIPVPPSAAG